MTDQRFTGSMCPIPGRFVSTGGTVEQAVASMLDLAERHYRHAATVVEHPATWAASVGAGNGLCLAAGVLARIEAHVVTGLYVGRFGAPPSAHHGVAPVDRRRHTTSPLSLLDERLLEIHHVGGPVAP